MKIKRATEEKLERIAKMSGYDIIRCPDCNKICCVVRANTGVERKMKAMASRKIPDLIGFDMKTTIMFHEVIKMHKEYLSSLKGKTLTQNDIDEIHISTNTKIKDIIQATIIDLEFLKNKQLNEWISVKDRLPKDNTSVIVLEDIYCFPICAVFYESDKSFESQPFCDDINAEYWMPLPEFRWDDVSLSYRYDSCEKISS